MSDFVLDGQPKTLELNDGVVVTVPPVAGVLRVLDGRARAFEAVAFDAMLEAAGLERHKEIELEVTPVPTARALAGEPAPSALNVEVQPPEGKAALVLVEDENGALSWHVPTAGSAARSFAPVGPQHFSIPLAGSGAPEGARFLGKLFKKVLKVFVYPVTDFIVGAIGKPIVRAWENSHRPYQLRTYSTENYRMDLSKVPSLGQPDWTRLSGGRALLFLHGTFSTCDGFRGMPTPTLAALEEAYGRRIIAFNHPTLGDDPLANVKRLYELIPSGVKLDVDVVAHSRGGLVARQLAVSSAERLRLGKVVLVGVPNRGTPLADADHVSGLLDRFTTLTKLVPGPAGTVLDAIVFVVKALAHGLISQLGGISAMDPRGKFLAQLSERQNLSTADYYAIGSDYEPKSGTPLFNISRLADAAADSAFGQAANDLVVPTSGSNQLTANITVPRAKVFSFGQADAVIHTDYFSQASTSTQLTSWLAGGGRGAARGLAQSRARQLGPAALQELRPHVINLSEGTFNRSGRYVTLQSDVDTIFKELEVWAGQQAAPKVMFWAHGGLIGEEAGLEIARKHVAWWKLNGVYPIYFVWETGLFNALRSVVESTASKLTRLGKRDLWDVTTDPVIERACRALGGVQLWGAMKQNAARASERGGGAYYVAERLAELRKRLPQLEVHAAGHSAGSIFLAHFLPTAAQLGVGTIQSLHLLAPAIRVDEFNRRLAPLLTSGIAHTTMYTMHRDYELDDDCFGVYRKSLLYLIHHALEPEARTPILGLEMSVRDDADAARAFGLGGSPATAEVIWSRTSQASGTGASLSTTHGGFDDDSATLGSVAARVLSLAEPSVAYPEGGVRGELGLADEWLDGVDISGWSKPARSEQVPAPVQVTTTSTPTNSVVTGSTVANDTVVQPVAAGSGRRLALCVGIDAYAGGNRLEGCVNDAKLWTAYLQTVGFEVRTLLDVEATHSQITSSLSTLLKSAQSGDSVVFQYAGHGYHVPDLDGDEASGEDQALVPHDFEKGAFLIDDDLRALLLAAPSGVRVTCFMDCCHSGTNTRVLLNRSAPQQQGNRRFLKVTEEQRRSLVNAHERFRSSLRRDATVRGRGFEPTKMTWVSFAACQDFESAFEHNGGGDFTRIALEVLSKRTGLRHAELFDQIQSGFGPQRAQTPVLDCSPSLRDGVIFQAS